MYSDSELDAAVAEGAISPDSAAALRAFVARHRASPPADEEQFRLLVQGVTDYAIYMLDSNGNVSSWNAGAQRIKGYTPDEIIGRHFSTFYTQADREAGEPQKALATAAREGRFEKEACACARAAAAFSPMSSSTPFATMPAG